MVKSGLKKNQIRPVQDKTVTNAKGSLHVTFQRTLVFFRAVGLFPAQGLHYCTSDKIRFKWLSIHTIRYLTCFLGMLLLNVFLINEVYHTGLKYEQINIAVIVSSSLWTILTMLKITKNWSEVLSKADVILDEVPAFETAIIRRKCLYATIGLLFLGISDYIAYLVHAIGGISVCNENKPVLETYYTLYHSWIFEYIPFNYWYASIYQVVEFHTVFILYFKDIIIVICSIYVSGLFNRFNSLILDEKNRPSWNELQIYYTKLSQLVQLLDDEISSLVFLAHMCNMFYICNEVFQLLDHVTEKKEEHCYTDLITLEIEEAIIHGYSFLALVIRTLVAILYPARVYTASRAPLDILHTLPSSKYDLDVQKFMDQVYYSKIGFTGLGFFYVTRDIVLSMIVTITTYELVLLQFHENI